MNSSFNSPPHPKVLQILANGSLEQFQNLSRAIRLWVLLKWLYSIKGSAALPSPFTYSDWRQAFFTDTHKDEKQEEIVNHDPNCSCHKTIEQWFIDLEISIEEWRVSIQKQIPISTSDLDQLLQYCLFAQVRKSLQSDFDLLVNKKFLERVENTTGRSKYYRRVEYLPILENFVPEVKLNTKTQAYLAGALGMFSFLDPKYPLLAEEISEEVNEDNHRVFLYIDYVVPESSPTEDAVDEIQSELQQIWDSGKIFPLLFTYRSAHQNQIKECVVYPVCIYFMEKAKYLCAYGKTPKGEINWYKFRLDRIISKRLVNLQWQDPRVPQLLRDKYEENSLPTPKVVNDKLKEAWGCDFFKQKTIMILRFDKDFHDAYVKGVSIHETFTHISYHEAIKLTKQYSLHLQQQELLLKILDFRPPTDSYYKVEYRLTDYYVLRWLRALGSKVEVFLPWDLRQEIAMEIEKAWNLYQT